MYNNINFGNEDKCVDFDNYYITKYKRFKEILTCCNNNEEFEKIKGTKGYLFSAQDEFFVKDLLDNYDDKLKPLRHYQIRELGKQNAIDLYIGFLNIFYNAEADNQTIEKIKFKLLNRLEIPQKQMSTMTDSLFKEYSKTLKEKLGGYDEYRSIGLKLQVQIQLYNFIFYWIQVYDNMLEIRNDETLSEKNLNVSSMTPEMEKYEAASLTLSTEIMNAYESDTEIQKLIKERDKLLKIGTNKRPLTRITDNQFYEVSEKLKNRMQNVELEVIRKHFPEFSYLPNADCQNHKSNDYIQIEELRKKQLLLVVKSFTAIIYTLRYQDFLKILLVLTKMLLN